MEDALNLHNEAERRREALAQETQARIEADADLQAQVNTESSTEIENALAVHQEAEQRRKNISEESQARYTEDVNQQTQTDTASAAIIQSAINLTEEAQKRRELAERLIEEVHDREREIQNLLAQIGNLYEIPLPGIDEKIASLQKQADATAEASLENSMSIHTEAEQRRKATEDLTNEIARNAGNDAHNQAQIATLVNAILEDTLNLRDEISRRREALTQEAQARISGDADLQAQVDTVSTASLENAHAVHDEAEKRRGLGNRVEALERDSELAVERDTYHSVQLDYLVNTVLQGALNLRDEIERRRTVADEAAKAFAEHSQVLQSEIDKTTTAVLENALSIQQSNETRRAEDSQERFTRFDEDGHIQDQVNTLAETCLRIMTSTAETQAKIEKIAQAAEAISGTTGVADDSEVDEMLAEIP